MIEVYDSLRLPLFLFSDHTHTLPSSHEAIYSELEILLETLFPKNNSM